MFVFHNHLPTVSYAKSFHSACEDSHSSSPKVAVSSVETTSSSSAVGSTFGGGNTTWRFEPVFFHKNSSQPLTKNEVMKTYIEERQYLTNSKAYVSHWMMDTNEKTIARTSRTKGKQEMNSTTSLNHGHKNQNKRPRSMYESKIKERSTGQFRDSRKRGALRGNRSKSPSSPNSLSGKISQTPIQTESSLSYQANDLYSNSIHLDVPSDYQANHHKQQPIAQQSQDHSCQETDNIDWPVVYREMFEALVGTEEATRIDHSYIQCMQRRRNNHKSRL